jgi:hypothetical protein
MPGARKTYYMIIKGNEHNPPTVQTPYIHF